MCTKGEEGRGGKGRTRARVKVDQVRGVGQRGAGGGGRRGELKGGNGWW